MNEIMALDMFSLLWELYVFLMYKNHIIFILGGWSQNRDVKDWLLLDLVISQDFSESIFVSMVAQPCDVTHILNKMGQITL